MSRRPRTLVVGYDGSDLADLALQWAVETAAHEQDPVEVVVAQSLESAVENWGDSVTGLLERTEETVDRAEKLVAALGCAEARVEVLPGEPTSVLVRLGKDAAAVVVGSTGHGPVAGALLGSVSRHLAAHATSPLVVVRPAADPQPRIVVGLDDRWSCLPALDFALSRAERTGGRVEALHAVRSADPHELSVGADPSRLPRTVAETVDEARTAYPDVPLSLLTVAARPAAALVRASEHAELVVLGARGRHPFARPLLASVGQQVLHHAHSPVAIVR